MSESAASDVDLQAVSKSYGEHRAVDQIDLHVGQGNFYALLGPSGCGKTTTLRLIAGFEQPDHGRILIGGRDVGRLPPYRRDVNTVFQHYALFPHLTVADNVGFGLREKRVADPDVRRRTAEALEMVRLGGLAHRKPGELSGGQQQRVARARALINRPAVLLLDEPLGALDRKLRHEMQIELKSIQHEVRITFVYVTHDQEEALTMSDVIVVMNEGRIQQQGSPEALYLRPVNRFVAGFIGSSNFIAGVLARHTAGSDRGRVTTVDGLAFGGRLTDTATAALDSAVTVALRPECVILSPA